MTPRILVPDRRRSQDNVRLAAIALHVAARRFWGRYGGYRRRLRAPGWTLCPPRFGQDLDEHVMIDAAGCRDHELSRSICPRVQFLQVIDAQGGYGLSCTE